MDFALADMQIINFNENRTVSAETEPVNGRAFASGVYSSRIVQLFRALAISNDAKRSARLPPTTLDNIGDAVQGRADLKKYFHMNAHGSHPMSWWPKEKPQEHESQASGSTGSHTTTLSEAAQSYAWHSISNFCNLRQRQQIDWETVSSASESHDMDDSA